MPLDFDNIESTTVLLERDNIFNLGMNFYEIKLPNKYLVFDKIYAFSKIIPNASSGRVYFQNAAVNQLNSNPEEYNSIKNIQFDGIRQAFEDEERSTICFSDPGVFIKDNYTSWYSVVNEVDICSYMAMFLQQWMKSALLKANQILMFGSSAGSFAALRTATFLENKTNVISVNGQIVRSLAYQNKNYRHDLLEYFEKCLQNNRVIPNIYFLCNYRDENIRLNFLLFNLLTSFPYRKQGVYRPNIVWDTYDGIEGHLRPNREHILNKVLAAEIILKSSQNEQYVQRSKENQSNDYCHLIKLEHKNNFLLIEKLSKLLGSEICKASRIKPHSFLSSDLKDVISYESNLRNSRGILEYIASLCPRNVKLLDFGCGNLPQKNIYEELGLDWIGLDYSDSLDPTTLTRKKSGLQKQVIEYAGKEIPFENEMFHIVWSNQSLEHIQDIDITFQEIARILKPQYFFAGSVSFLEPYHARSTYSYTPYGFKLICEKYGLTVQKILPGVSGLTLILKRLSMIFGLDNQSRILQEAFKNDEKLTKIIEKTMYSKGYNEFDVASLLLQVCGCFNFIAIKE